jgi:hypothetical protein
VADAVLFFSLSAFFLLGHRELVRQLLRVSSRARAVGGGPKERTIERAAWLLPVVLFGFGLWILIS